MTLFSYIVAAKICMTFYPLQFIKKKIAQSPAKIMQFRKFAPNLKRKTLFIVGISNREFRNVVAKRLEPPWKKPFLKVMMSSPKHF